MTHPTFSNEPGDLPDTVDELTAASLLTPADDGFAFLRNGERLTELLRLEPFETDVRALLADLVEAVRSRFDVPVVLVNMLLNNAQVVVAQAGSAMWLDETSGSPAEWAICSHTVERRAPFVVTDASTDAVVKDNPLVTHDGVKAYAGVPLMTADQAVGALCVLDVVPRQFSDDDIAFLTDISRQLIERLEARSRGLTES